MRNHWIDENRYWANNYLGQLRRALLASGFRFNDWQVISRQVDEGDADIWVQSHMVPPDGPPTTCWGMLFTARTEGARLWLMMNAPPSTNPYPTPRNEEPCHG